MHHIHERGLDLTSSLIKDHEVILKMLERLEAKLGYWKSSKSIEYESLTTFLEFAKTFIDKCHHGKEERCLFPCLERRGIPREHGPIGVMLQEHEQGRQIVKQIERALKDLGEEEAKHLEITELCESYVELLKQHIAKENEVLFPMGESVTSMEDKTSTNTCYERVESAEVGHGVHEKYVKLADSF
ncbi:MAG: hemerythrin domain-containing protein [Thermoproteota archaeon]